LDESQELISLARKRLQQAQSEFGKIASENGATATTVCKKRPLTILYLKAKWALCAGIPGK